MTTWAKLEHPPTAANLKHAADSGVTLEVYGKWIPAMDPDVGMAQVTARSLNLKTSHKPLLPAAVAVMLATIIIVITMPIIKDIPFTRPGVI